MARKTLTHVAPERFAEVRDNAHVKNSELARAMGVSPTRVTELTRTKGGTSRQLARVRAAITSLKGEAARGPSEFGWYALLGVLALVAVAVAAAAGARLSP